MAVDASMLIPIQLFGLGEDGETGCALGVDDAVVRQPVVGSGVHLAVGAERPALADQSTRHGNVDGVIGKPFVCFGSV